MDSVVQYAGEFKDLTKRPRNFVAQVLNLGTVVFVLSGSMEPGFKRGDILFLTMYEKDPLVAGDVVVFQIEGRDIPIVHRIHNVHEKPDGTVSLLTKGDDNQVDDRGLYAHKQLFISRKEIMGRAQMYCPYIGMITIWLNDYPWFKVLLLGSMGFFVIIGRE